MKSLNDVQLFVTPWTVAYHAPPSMGFSRQEYWSGLPFPLGDCNFIGLFLGFQFSSVQLLSLVHSLWPQGPQHAMPPCPLPTPGVYPNSHPLSWWCHPTTSSSVVPFSSCPQSFPVSRSFQMSQLFTSGGQSIGISASASVLPMNIQGWFPSGLTGLISS